MGSPRARRKSPPTEPIEALQQPVHSYLPSDLTVDCPYGDFTHGLDPSGASQHTVYMNAGDTIFVASNARAKLEVTGPSFKVLVATFLMCGPTTTPLPEPQNEWDWVESRSGTNLYDYPDAVFTEATYQTKTVYTAQEDGLHTCWVIYSCGGINQANPVPDVTFKKDGTYLLYYEPNQYPGKNFKVDSPNMLLRNTSIQTPGGPGVWDAGTSAQTDNEVVVYWMPRVSNCGVSDSLCAPFWPYFSNDQDTFFDWRIKLYQYNNNVVCNENWGTWTNYVVCPHNHHHCDNDAYLGEFPIVFGQGSEGDCGTATALRKFKVFTQIRKSDDYHSDIEIHNASAAMNNFIAYSRTDHDAGSCGTEYSVYDPSGAIHGHCCESNGQYGVYTEHPNPRLRYTYICNAE